MSTTESLTHAQPSADVVVPLYVAGIGTNVLGRSTVHAVLAVERTLMIQTVCGVPVDTLDVAATDAWDDVPLHERCPHCLIES